MEYFRDRGSLPGLPPPLDFNSVPLLCPLVAAFRLVYELKRGLSDNWPISLF
jgi:hypothetical protein